MDDGYSKVDKGRINDVSRINLNKALIASKSICKIFYHKNNKKFNGTGFFMIINKDLKCLISNYHIIDEDFINQNINIKWK